MDEGADVRDDVRPSGAPVVRRDAFRAFYEESAPGALRLARLLTSSADDAHDVVHDAYVGMLRSWDRIDEPAAYLRRSITNGAATTFRQRAGRQAREDGLRAELATASEPADEYLADQIEALPWKQRAVVVLRFYAELSVAEIAAATGMRPGSVGPTLGRALAELRKEVDA